MDLSFTEQQQAFREEIRAWLAEHVPPEPLASFDTAEGFRQHREWEATLNSGRWGMVTWPEELGGRGCDLIEWLIFEEEYYRARAPLRVNQNGIFLLGPTKFHHGRHAVAQEVTTLFHNDPHLEVAGGFLGRAGNLVHTAGEYPAGHAW